MGDLGTDGDFCGEVAMAAERAAAGRLASLSPQAPVCIPHENVRAAAHEGGKL